MFENQDRQGDIILFGKKLPLEVGEEEREYIQKLIKYIEKQADALKEELGYVATIEELVLLKLADKYFETLSQLKRHVGEIEEEIQNLKLDIKDTLKNSIFS